MMPEQKEGEEDIKEEHRKKIVLYLGGACQEMADSTIKLGVEHGIFLSVKMLEALAKAFDANGCLSPVVVKQFTKIKAWDFFLSFIEAKDKNYVAVREDPEYHEDSVSSIVKFISGLVKNNLWTDQDIQERLKNIAENELKSEKSLFLQSFSDLCDQGKYTDEKLEIVRIDSVDIKSFLMSDTDSFFSSANRIYLVNYLIIHGLSREDAQGKCGLLSPDKINDIVFDIQELLGLAAFADMGAIITKTDSWDFFFRNAHEDNCPTYVSSLMTLINILEGAGLWSDDPVIRERLDTCSPADLSDLSYKLCKISNSNGVVVDIKKIVSDFIQERARACLADADSDSDSSELKSIPGHGPGPVIRHTLLGKRTYTQQEESPPDTAEGQKKLR